MAIIVSLLGTVKINTYRGLMKINDFALENMVDDLIAVCQEDLGIGSLPDIRLVSDQPSIDDTSFGMFDGQSICVITQNRHPMDIMRTLAHELVHWKQRCAGEELDGADGSTTENDANAIAGSIMRKFGRLHPEYFMNSFL